MLNIRIGSGPDRVKYHASCMTPTSVKKEKKVIQEITIDDAVTQVGPGSKVCLHSSRGGLSLHTCFCFNRTIRTLFWYIVHINNVSIRTIKVACANLEYNASSGDITPRNRARKSRTTLQNKVRLKVLPEQLTLFVNTYVTFKNASFNIFL